MLIPLPPKTESEYELVGFLVTLALFAFIAFVVYVGVDSIRSDAACQALGYEGYIRWRGKKLCLGHDDNGAVIIGPLAPAMIPIAQ